MKRARIEALWRQNPNLTQVQIRRATGAPLATIRHVYNGLVAAGVLEPKPTTWNALDQAGAGAPT